MRYHITVVFESVNDLQLFTKAVLSSELDRHILTEGKRLSDLNDDIEKTREILRDLQNKLPKEPAREVVEDKASPETPKVSEAPQIITG